MKNNNKQVLLLIFIVVIVGFVIGAVLNRQPAKTPEDKSTASKMITPGKDEVPQSKEKEIQDKYYPSPTQIKISDVPVPTSDPYIDYPSVVYAKTDEKISLTFPGGAGDWPKSIKLTLNKGIDGKNVIGTWDDIKVGQHVRVKIIKPGKEGEIYIKM